ncbi:hypothetical protein MRX96_031670 [Rhipicephalus microplus]
MRVTPAPPIFLSFITRAFGVHTYARARHAQGDARKSTTSFLPPCTTHWALFDATAAPLCELESRSSFFERAIVCQQCRARGAVSVCQRARNVPGALSRSWRSPSLNARLLPSWSVPSPCLLLPPGVPVYLGSHRRFLTVERSDVALIILCVHTRGS